MDKIIPDFVIEYKKSFTASGVGDVISFNDREIRLSLVEGGRVCITGEGLKIVRFNELDGSLSLSGKVNAVRYDEQKPPILKRIFK